MADDEKKKAKPEAEEGAEAPTKTKDGKKSFINERLLAAANYAVDIDALGSSKEHKQDFATLFRKK